MLVAAGVMASFVTLKSRGNAFYALTVVWGLFGVVVANLTEQIKPVVASVAGIMIILIAAALLQARTKMVYW